MRRKIRDEEESGLTITGKNAVFGNNAIVLLIKHLALGESSPEQCYCITFPLSLNNHRQSTLLLTTIGGGDGAEYSVFFWFKVGDCYVS